MPIFNKRHHRLAIITLIALLPLGCGSSSESDRSIQATLDELILDLNAAVSGNNATALGKIISSAKQLRPTSQTQTQSKNLLLTSAQGKLAQLQFQTISAEANLVRSKFQLAMNHASLVARLRSKAASLSQAGQRQGTDESQAIQSSLVPLLAVHNAKLREVTTRISNLQTQSKVDRQKANTLRDAAEALFDAAEQAGLIDGHKTFKDGVKKMRQSQHIDMSAATIELETQIQDEPFREDAKAELEAITSILNGLKHTSDLLRQIRESSINGAASLRQVADELDTQASNIMNSVVDTASQLIQRWDGITTLVQEALRGSNRSGNISREAKRAAATWKLDMEWTLGHMEESKRRFLMDELHALTVMIDSRIVTSGSKWQELSKTTSALIETATITAISSYESAMQYATNAGLQGNTILSQLEARIGRLKGQPIIQTPVSSTGGNPDAGSMATTGFASPQDLIIAFNNLPSLNEFDGTTAAPSLANFYVANDEDAAEALAFTLRFQEAMANFIIAIANTMGADAFQEYLASAPPTQEISMKIDVNSIQMQGDNAATVTDVNGSLVSLENSAQGWHIVYVNDNFMMFDIDMRTQMIDALKAVTKQVNDGQFQTIDEVLTAFGQQ